MVTSVGAAGPEKGFSGARHAVLTQSAAFSTDFSHLKPHCSSTSRLSIPACLHPSLSELSDLTSLAFKDSISKTLCITKRQKPPSMWGDSSIVYYVHTKYVITKLCPTLCNPMDCSLPGSSVLHCLPEFAPCPLRQ